MDRFAALAVALLAPLAGCVGEAPLESTEAPPELAPPEPAPPASTELAPVAFEGVLQLSVGTPVVSANPASAAADFLFEFEVPANATSAAVTMTWNATQSTSASLRLLVETAGADGATLASGDGPSPLVVPLDVAEQAGTTLRTRTFASSNAGFAKDQPFAVVVTFL